MAQKLVRKTTTIEEYEDEDEDALMGVDDEFDDSEGELDGADDEEEGDELAGSPKKPKSKKKC